MVFGWSGKLEQKWFRYTTSKPILGVNKMFITILKCNEKKALEVEAKTVNLCHIKTHFRFSASFNGFNM